MYTHWPLRCVVLVRPQENPSYICACPVIVLLTSLQGRAQPVVARATSTGCLAYGVSVDLCVTLHLVAGSALGQAGGDADVHHQVGLQLKC